MHQIVTALICSHLLITAHTTVYAADMRPNKLSLIATSGVVQEDGGWEADISLSVASLYDHGGAILSPEKLATALSGALPNIVLLSVGHTGSSIKKGQIQYRNPTSLSLSIGRYCSQKLRQNSIRPRGDEHITMAEVEVLCSAIERLGFIKELSFSGFHSFNDAMIARFAQLQYNTESRDMRVILSYNEEYDDALAHQLKKIKDEHNERKSSSKLEIAPQQNFGTNSSSSSSSSTSSIIAVPAPSAQAKNGPISNSVIREYNLPHTFSPEIARHAQQLKFSMIEQRYDLRALPLVTIDDADAKDHDDAVWAVPDDQRNNPGGFKIIVAIADVGYFVKPGDMLDVEARLRGTSVYFPDQVIPMLPERLSNDLCSLVPNQDRPALAVEMHIDKEGRLKSFTFFLAIMRSWGKLTYKDVQAAIMGKPHDIPPQVPLMAITDLYEAYKLLKKARKERGTLDTYKPDKKIEFSPEGQAKKVLIRPRYESHQIVEEMMILANVAAATLLSSKGVTTLYRIHATPKPEAIAELKKWLQDKYLGGEKITEFNQSALTKLLNIFFDTKFETAAQELVMRAQALAVYSPDNIGHFGLNLDEYTHFTSPIRRYADLVVHRGIRSLLANNAGLYPYTLPMLRAIGEDISHKERRAKRAVEEAIKRCVGSMIIMEPIAAKDDNF